MWLAMRYARSGAVLGSGALLGTNLPNTSSVAAHDRGDGVEQRHRLAHWCTRDRERAGLALVPWARDLPAEDVEENLETRFKSCRAACVMPPMRSTRCTQEHAEAARWDLFGGQQQPLANARAQVMRPRCLILGEPSEGLQLSSRTPAASSPTALRATWRSFWSSSISSSPVTLLRPFS